MGRSLPRRCGERGRVRTLNVFGADFCAYKNRGQKNQVESFEKVLKMCRVAFVLVAFVAVAVYSQPAGGQDAPPFLRRATPAQIQSFQQLIQSNGHLTDAALDAKVDAWVKTQGGNVAADWAEFQQFVKQSQSQAEAAHNAAIASFSPAAKKADADLTAISNDATLSVQAKGQKIQDYLGALPANVRQELEKAQGGQQ